ncbi:AGAP010053-PA, partial [Anopheles gambiae str. PEST]
EKNRSGRRNHHDIASQVRTGKTETQFHTHISTRSLQCSKTPLTKRKQHPRSLSRRRCFFLTCVCVCITCACVCVLCSWSISFLLERNSFVESQPPELNGFGVCSVYCFLECEAVLNALVFGVHV